MILIRMMFISAVETLKIGNQEHRTSLCPVRLMMLSGRLPTQENLEIKKPIRLLLKVFDGLVESKIITFAFFPNEAAVFLPSCKKKIINSRLSPCMRVL